MERKILVIEANEIKYQLLQEYLTELNYPTDSIIRFSTLKESLTIKNSDVDFILADVSLHDTDRMTALRMLHTHFINIPVIVLLDDTSKLQHEPANGYLVYSSYDSEQLSKAITYAKEQTARIATEINRELHTLIKEQKEHLDDILFSINDAIWSRHADTLELLYANNAYHKLYGYSPDDINKSIHKHSVHPDDKAKFFACIEEIRTNGKTEIIYRYAHQDGSVKTFRSTASLKKGRDGNPDIINGVTEDITMETELHEQLRDSEQRLLATINNTRDLIWSVNKDLQIIFCNKPYQDFIYSLSGVIPHAGNYVLGDWGSTSFITTRTKDYERALSGESFIRIVEEVQNGEVMYNEISSSPIIDHDGNIIGVNCIARDITQQKKQYFKIRRQNEKLREIAWIQSHKVRGPVASILGLTELFDSDVELSAYNKDILEQIKRATHELDKVIKEVVDNTIDIDYTFTETDIISSQQ